MTQQNPLLKFLENFVRSNLYLFIFFRFIVNSFFTKFIYESDFKILKVLEKLNLFKNQRDVIVDIGANDGISYKTIRNFIKKTQIHSFEPNKENFLKLKKLKKNDKNFFIHNVGLSSKKRKPQLLYLPYFKSYPLSPFASLSKTDVNKRLRSSLFVKNLQKKIKIKDSKVYIRRLDDFKLNAKFIKIDIEGHEFECILGSLKTIKKKFPIIMLEYDKKSCLKIYKILKKMKYKKFLYDSNKNILREHKNQNTFNIFFIYYKYLNVLKEKIKIE